MSTNNINAAGQGITMAAPNTNLVGQPVGTTALNTVTGQLNMVGSNGQVVTISGTTASWAKPQITLTDGNGRSMTMNELFDFIDVMKKRMMIITPLFEKHEHYPALKEAYEQYKVIERLCLGDEKEQKGP